MGVFDVPVTHGIPVELVCTSQLGHLRPHGREPSLVKALDILIFDPVKDLGRLQTVRVSVPDVTHEVLQEHKLRLLFALLILKEEFFATLMTLFDDLVQAKGLTKHAGF
jgi:hypothetical protein